MGGWSLYVARRKAQVPLQLPRLLRFEVARVEPSGGKHQARMEFVYDGGGLGKAPAVALYVDGKRSAKARRAHARLPLLDGRNDGRRLRRRASQCRRTIGPNDNTFNGKVNWVQIDIDAAAKDVDHKIGAEERFMIAMARQ
jgi:arylsulfatase